MNTFKSKNNITPVDFTHVKLIDSFWLGRQKQVICNILKVGIEKVEAENGGFDNFIQASKKNNGEPAKAFAGDVYFLDSDIYKLIEAMSYCLLIDTQGDKDIEDAKKYIRKKLEYWIPYIQGAQEEDGYLDTFFTLERGTQHMSATTSETNRWTDFAAHEMYVAGHFYEAAAAHYRASKDTRLLDAAIKNADLIESIFGENGTKKATSGHQEIELALIKLATACTEAGSNCADGIYKGLYSQKTNGYIKLAKHLLNLRGDTKDRYGSYSFAAEKPLYRQDHAPAALQTEAVGHVVRAMYQYIAMTDIALLSDSNEYEHALNCLWQDITERKTYITGGMGITENDESFGLPYQLPVNGAYSETCGSIGSVMWNYRMNLLYGDSKYIDTMECTLYNAVIDGVNFDGNKFFYQNPIQSNGDIERSYWFGCACCPPNLMRLIASLGGYIYTQHTEGINVNLYIGNNAEFKVKGKYVSINMDSHMPWKGNVKITVDSNCTEPFALCLRIPYWADGKFSMNINEVDTSGKTISKNGYVTLYRIWKKGDIINILFDMTAKRTYRAQQFKDTLGYTAIQKGPLVYVAESADNTFDLNHFSLPKTSELTEEYVDNLVGGDDPYSLKKGIRITADGRLSSNDESLHQRITFIPYYAWNNRGRGFMRTYIKEYSET